MKVFKLYFFLIFLLFSFQVSYGKDNIAYSLQVYTSNSFQFASKFLRKVRHKNKKFFIYRTDKGRWTVRIFLFPTIKEAASHMREIQKITGVENISIVPTDLKKVNNSDLNRIKSKRNRTGKRKKLFNDSGKKKVVEKKRLVKVSPLEKGQNITKKRKKQDFVIRKEKILSLSDFLKLVEKNNLEIPIAFKDYKRNLLNFYRNLEFYDFNWSISGSFIEKYYVKSNFSNEKSLSISGSKVLYDGGVKSLLEKEFYIVSLLEKEKVIRTAQLLKLSAVSTYIQTFYHQELKNLIEKQLENRELFFSSLKEKYKKGTKISEYAFLTEEREILKLKDELSREQNIYKKWELELRTMGEINDPLPLKLLPPNISYSPIILRGEREILEHSPLVNIDRYKIKNAILSYQIEKKKGKPLVSVKSGISISNTVKAPFFNLGISITYPIFDERKRVRMLLLKKIELLKEKLTLKKDLKDVAKKLLSLYEDYKFYEKEEGLLKAILELDKKRLEISKEKYIEGVGDYTSVRDSWNDLLTIERRLLLSSLLNSKILFDISILEGSDLR